MIKLKFYGMLAIAAHLISPAHGVNYKILNSEAEAYASRVSSQIRVTEADIRETLTYTIVRRGEEVDDRYTEPEGFSSFCETLIGSTDDEYLRGFVTSCKTVYEEAEGDVTKQISTYLLLEAVKKTYDARQKILMKRQQLRREEEELFRTEEPAAVRQAMTDFIAHMDQPDIGSYLRRLTEVQRTAGAEEGNLGQFFGASDAGSASSVGTPAH